MTPHDYSDQEAALIEAQGLLAQKPWRIEEGRLLEGERVCIFVDPYPTAPGTQFDVPITVLLLRGEPAALTSISLVLSSLERDGAAYFGRFNPRGQILFRNLPSGMYRAKIAEPLPLVTTLEQLPRQVWQTIVAASVPLQLVVPQGSGWLSTFRTASGSLNITLRISAMGDLLVGFESTDPMWNGSIVGLAWRSAMDIADTQTSWQVLLAALGWNPPTQAFVADMNLGQAPPTCDLMLPEQPLPENALSADFAGVLEQSLAQTLSSPALQVWQQNLDRSPPLATVVWQIIADAVRRGTEAGRLWKSETARLYCLVSVVFVHLGEVAASFGRLTPPLTSQLIPAAALRAGTAIGAVEIELLELPHAEANLVLKLSLGPTSGGQGTLVVTVTTANPPDPIRQAKVSLRDADGALLEITPTDEDGLALFQALEAGAYQIEVDHDGIVWQIPLVLDARQEK